MKKLLFASDIDNTLMFSHRHKADTDICIEYLDGKEQGFVTKDTPHRLAEINAQCEFVPITTRSIAQYTRIHWPRGCVSRYAVAANGGVLLVDGQADEAWLRQSRELVAPWLEELERVQNSLAGKSEIRNMYLVDGLFLFAGCHKAEEAEQLREQYLEKTALDVELTGRKVYFFPPALNKGAALQRLRERLGSEYIVCAGDSKIDIPMLREADAAITPHGLTLGEYERKWYVHDGQNRFSDFVLACVTKEMIRYYGEADI